MVWWVLVWDRFCSVSDKESLDILETAESPKLYLQDLDRTFKEERGQGIVFELSTALNELPSDEESDDAQLLRALYSIAARGCLSVLPLRDQAISQAFWQVSKYSVTYLDIP